MSHADRDLSVDWPELDHDKALMKADKEQRKRGEKEKDRREDRDRKEREQDDTDFENGEMHRFPHRRRSAHRSEDSIVDQSHQEGEGTDNFGTGPGSSSYDDKAALKSE